MRREIRLAAVLIVALAVLGAGGGLVLAALRPGPAQPIPFSHRLHAGSKEISCFFCHPGATRSSNAGMPPIEKCLLCHNVVASNFPPIHKLRISKKSGKPVKWRRVNVVPDFVHFSHQIHLSRGFDCGDCHGNVKGMDRVEQAHKLDMNFCVTCHDQQGARVDCITCHY